MLHFATIENFVAAFRDALPKLELISTSRSSGGNQNVTRNVSGKVCYTGQFFRASYVTTKLRDKLQEKLPSVTGLRRTLHKITFVFDLGINPSQYNNLL